MCCLDRSTLHSFVPELCVNLSFGEKGSNRPVLLGQRLCAHTQHPVQILKLLPLPHHRELGGPVRGAFSCRWSQRKRSVFQFVLIILKDKNLILWNTNGPLWQLVSQQNLGNKSRLRPGSLEFVVMFRAPGGILRWKGHWEPPRVLWKIPLVTLCKGTNNRGKHTGERSC